MSETTPKAPPAGAAPRVRALWDRLERLPGGRLLFSRLLGRIAPYTRTIAPRVRELRPGYARVEMRDRRRVRNHLDSVHALAIANLAELASGLALNYALPEDVRAILTGLSIEFVKKGRGPLTAEARLEPPEGREAADHAFESVVRDAEGEVVARATARWRVGPRE